MPILDLQKIRKYIKSKNYYFKLFDINYTKNEKETIEKFNIEKQSTFTHFGNFTELLDKNLNTFLLEIGKNSKSDISILEKTIIKLVKKVLSAYKTEYFWIDIRVTLRDNNFDNPRWHKDAPFFNNNDKTSKFVTTLKGSGTLLLQHTKKNNEIYKKIESKARNERKGKSIDEQMKINIKYRSIFAKKFGNEKIIQPSNNQAVIFYTGFDDIYGAIHSDPSLIDERISRLVRVFFQKNSNEVCRLN